MSHDAPILEFDPDPTAIIEPAAVFEDHEVDLPAGCVLCFFQEVLDGLAEQGVLAPVGRLISEIGPNPIYALRAEGSPLPGAAGEVIVVHPGVGAPLAAGFLEELIARGCRRFIACGGAGVLDRAIAVGHLLVPVSAVRDEGTSYHYLPPAREVAASPAAVAAIERVLTAQRVEYLLTKTWTTDGLYRETQARRARRLAEGCLAVEMEAAAFFAVAQFRGVDFGQILYGGDAVIAGEWDARGWQSRGEIRQRLFWLAMEACGEIEIRD